MDNIPKGYKKTEIGVIPEDWEIKKIKDFTECTSGGTPSTIIKEYWDGDIKWMSSGELNDKRIHEVRGRITDLGLKNSSTKIVPDGSVLIGLAGQGKTRGTVAINYVDLCLNQSIAAILPSSYHESEYLYFNLDSRYKELRSLSTGGEGRGGLNLSIIRNIQVPYPSIIEQKLVASSLSDIDSLISSFEKLIEKKKNIKQGVMQELLTGKRRVAGFSGEWKSKSIEDLEKEKLVRLCRGNVISKTDIAKTQGEYPIYSSSIHNQGLFGRYGKYMFDEELITWSVDGGGDFFYRSKHKYSVTNVCGYMRVNTSSIDYYFLALQLQLLHSKKNFDYQMKAHPSIIRKAYIVSLPSLEEQKCIALLLHDKEKEISMLDLKLYKLKQIKQGAMQQLLTGKIRLINK